MTTPWISLVPRDTNRKECCGYVIRSWWEESTRKTQRTFSKEATDVAAFHSREKNEHSLFNKLKMYLKPIKKKKKTMKIKKKHPNGIMQRNTRYR